MEKPEESLSSELKKFMRLIPQPVTIITTIHNSKLVGITMSSFTSISMTPPVVLASLSKTAPSYTALMSKGKFVVNLLNKGQDFLGERFAGMHKIPDKFHDVKVNYNERGLPVLADSAANIDCDISKSIDAGDHTVILATPVSINIKKKSEPLVYYNQQFCHVVNKGTLVLPEDYV